MNEELIAGVTSNLLIVLRKICVATNLVTF